MTAHFFSFTKTWMRFIKGEMDVATLAALAADDTVFHFSCARAHVLGEATMAPMETTWGTVAGDKQQASHDSEQVPLSVLTEARVRSWLELRRIINLADINGRVNWGISGYVGREQEIAGVGASVM